MAKTCCVVFFACKCGDTFKGRKATQNWTNHQKKCKAGAAKLPEIN